jgi:hypothetical protein
VLESITSGTVVEQLSPLFVIINILLRAAKDDTSILGLKPVLSDKALISIPLMYILENPSDSGANWIESILATIPRFRFWATRLGPFGPGLFITGAS